MITILCTHSKNWLSTISKQLMTYICRKLFNLAMEHRCNTNVQQHLLTHYTSGPKAPHDEKYNIYLRPLIDELVQLQKGVPGVYDTYRNEKFTLRATIMLHVHDFTGQAKVFHSMEINNNQYELIQKLEEMGDTMSSPKLKFTPLSLLKAIVTTGQRIHDHVEWQSSAWSPCYAHIHRIGYQPSQSS